MEPISINLPLEIWKEIIISLPRKSLAQVDQVSKELHKLASADYRLYISKIKLTTDVVRANIQLLWNKPEEKYSVNAYGKLTIYSRFNILGNLLNSSEIQKIKDAVNLTLEEAYRLAVDNKIYICAINSDNSFIDTVAMYSDKYPINEVACCLKNSNQFASIEDQTYDLFMQNIFYGNHTAFLENYIIPTHHFECNRNKGQPHNLDFHQAIHNPGAKPDKK